MTCADMIESVGLDANDTGIPKLILDLVDKTYLFKVETNISEETRYEKSYRVKKMTADPELVSAFKAKNAIRKVNSVSEEVSIGKAVEVDVEGDESNVESVAQDLMDKFTDQGVDTGTDTIDLTTDIHDVETTKRDFSFVASTSDGPNMEPVIKQVKIEKD
ncbi:unnamed protein product [Trifolium pratense]|uniref:Uncharacterized protein n=1 Tax=Trifolium pratense TaxID=57577 RepID=A0ACB0LIC7_TRIPR|nr:unnamed protein product [Trifolium pratense]